MRLRRAPCLVALLFAGGTIAGCRATPRVATVSEADWRAAQNSPRSSFPPPRIKPDRPTARTSARPLTREDVLDVANAHEPQHAIEEIDRHPLAFPIDGETLAWFDERLAPPELIDYLRKRAQVDWDDLHGRSPDGGAPAREGSYVDVPAPAPRMAAPSGAPVTPTPGPAPAPPESEGGWILRTPAPAPVYGAPPNAPIPRSPGPAGLYPQQPGQAPAPAGLYRQQPGQVPAPAGLYRQQPGQAPAPAGLYPQRTPEPVRPMPIKK